MVVMMTMVAVMIVAMTVMVMIAVIHVLKVLRRARRMGVAVRSLILLRNGRRLWLTSKSSTAVGIRVAVVVRERWREEGLRLLIVCWRKFEVKWLWRGIRWDV
jgi:uncharacterized protein with PQ loop repeat